MKFIAFLLFLIIVILCVIFGPLLWLWAINALGFTVAYTFKTWFAAFLLGGSTTGVFTAFAKFFS